MTSCPMLLPESTIVGVETTTVGFKNDEIKTMSLVRFRQEELVAMDTL